MHRFSKDLRQVSSSFDLLWIFRFFFSSYEQIYVISNEQRSRFSATVECTVPKLKRHLVSAGMSHLHRNIISHPLPEVAGKVHLRLREHFVYDCLGDPALCTTKTTPVLDWRALYQGADFTQISLVHRESVKLQRKLKSCTFRSKLSNHVNLVLFGSSAQGFITIQVGPFSALKKWNEQCTHKAWRISIHPLCTNSQIFL